LPACIADMAETISYSCVVSWFGGHLSYWRYKINCKLPSCLSLFYITIKMYLHLCSITCIT